MSSYFDDASLVMIPSGYKTSKVYSVKPTDGSGDLTFSRSNDTATRVNSAGLIEKVRTNICLQSQTIDNATSWSNTLDTGATITVTANYAAAPDGTTTADRIQMALNGGAYAQRNQSITLSAGGEYTYSVYLKSLSGTPTIIFFYDNVNNKTATLTNDWVRYTWTFTSTGNVLPRFVLEAGTSSSADFLAWGCQLETGVATDYIPTTTAAVSVGPVANVPRLDYLNSSCPRLNLEPQRTNLANWSEQADQYTKVGATIGSNVVTSPDGYTNADSLIEDGSNGAHAFYNFGLTTFTAAAYTASVFAKKGSRDWFALQLYHSSSHVAYFNLNAGVVGTVAAGATATITNYGNGWYRCTITATTTANAGGIAIYGANADNSISYAGTNGLAAAYFYGWQLELGAYATSYIGPTLGAAVTRGADACSKTGISSLIGQTEGTLFVDFVFNNYDTTAFIPIVLTNTSADQVYFLLDQTGQVLADFYFNSSYSARISTSFGFLVKGTRYKMALVYKENDFAFYINGQQIGTDNSGIVRSMTSANFVYPYAGGYGPSGNTINQALLFKTRLSNSSLAELTSL